MCGVLSIPENGNKIYPGERYSNPPGWSQTGRNEGPSGLTMELQDWRKTKCASELVKANLPRTSNQSY